MHGTSNLSNMRTKKVGATVEPLYVITLWPNPNPDPDPNTDGFGS